MDALGLVLDQVRRMALMPTFEQLLQNMSRRPSWSVRMAPGSARPLSWAGAVDGDVEWYDFSSRIFDDRFTDGFLIRGDTDFVVGELFAAPLLG